MTLLKTDQYEGLASFTDGGTLGPLTTDHKGQVIRAVAPAGFALPLPDQKGPFLPLRVALIRDLRRQLPGSNREEETAGDCGIPAWWDDGWEAEPTKAEPTTAQLIPMVTTASPLDAGALAQPSIRRWPVQEKVIKDFLLPLGLDTHHGFAKTAVINSEGDKKRTAWEKRLSSIKQWAGKAKERSSKASLRYSRLWQETQAKGEERYRVLDQQVQALEPQALPPSPWKAERNRLKAEAESEMAGPWRKVYEVLDKSNKEHAKWERSCGEQCDLLRALEDLDAPERTMDALDNRKDQVMTVCKLALPHLVMWGRDHFFPASYAHATWGRLAPFFQLPGVVTSDQQAVSVHLRPFNDRQNNRDLVLLCQHVNGKQLHLPDGRLLRFNVQEMARPILHRQQRLKA